MVQAYGGTATGFRAARRWRLPRTGAKFRDHGRVNGRALRDLIQRWAGKAEVDDEFATNVAAARDMASAELDGDPWSPDQPVSLR
ncbi:hypothetical protein DFJ66_4093 [Saccharothrix variisporea]|uniref:Uncharacterized protein n=1 Tax=Saccharothrix variisporea TaxID=543527 RepID=A0A495XGW7_9PSEU|nr:hypothetical protein DFJ66_4093 [Saccharothrix variisporea]